MVYQSATLELARPKRIGFEVKDEPLTPNSYFQKLFPAQTQQFGPAFLELKESSGTGLTKITPISINVDLFSSIFSDSRLGLSVVYFEPEMQFYYNSPFQLVFKPVSPEKLQLLYRGLLIQAAKSFNHDVNILNLFCEFRSDRIAKAVVQRAKSVLAADSSFFSATSPHQRIQGPELHERLMRVLCETMLEPREGACLTVTEAYRIFCRLSEQRSLGQIKRSMFKEIMRDLIKDVHGLGLRRDVPDSSNKQQEAWRGLKVVDVEVLAA